MTDGKYLKGSGLAGWSIKHPISVAMIALAVMVVGFINYQQLSVALLPELSYPGIRIRILDSGVSANIMEDAVTRQLEEQLAITEDAIGVQSRTTEGASAVDLNFQYGKDIDIALRDASTRLDRAKRFLPDTINPPIIYKFDPSQIPVAEFVIASPLRDPVSLRDWVDYTFSKWFVNLPGVAAVEVGGGLIREIQVIPEPSRLISLGLTADSIVTALERGNIDDAAGRIETQGREYVGRTAGRFTSVEDIGDLPIALPKGGRIQLRDVAQIIDGHEDERLRVRLDGRPGVKLSIQKQPAANTVGVVDLVHQRMAWLKERSLLPNDIKILPVADQSIYVRNALSNATGAALGGAALAMLVVYLFLGNLRRTLLVGSAIPLSILVTFALMGLGGLSLNIMTLGGLALGVGMVVDSTIVMLENVYRHQRLGEDGLKAGTEAAREVNSAVVASTSTNLAAILPFLFISGLIGLLFKELIFTISAAIFGSMIVALTLVPAFGSRIPATGTGRMRQMVDGAMARLSAGYANALHSLLVSRLLKTLVAALLIALLAIALPILLQGKQIFLPNMDDGRVQISITADPGIPIDTMDLEVQKVEALLKQQPEVDSVFTIVGGRIFGRSQRETSNQSSLYVQLLPVEKRRISNNAWVKKMTQAVRKLGIPGFKVRMRTGAIRGVRVNRGNDDITLRITGAEQSVMDEIGYRIIGALKGSEGVSTVKGLRNFTHSSEEVREEMVFRIDHERLAALGLTVETIARATRLALEGMPVTKYLENDRSYEIRVRLPKKSSDTAQSLESVQVAADPDTGDPVYLSDVAALELVAAPAEILRDNQRRIVEVTATLTGGTTLSEASDAVWARIAQLDIPEGYDIYDAGAIESLKEGQNLTAILLGLALFLVFVVMAVQYESLRNPLIILLGVPFTLIGVAGGLAILQMPLSMPVWLGVIMLAGIVVNNAIVLVEYFEIERHRGLNRLEAIVEAGRVRLKPILMTTLTTACGLMPLALGLGEGAEMLQPLAVTIVFGLTFSMLVTLVFIPILCSVFGAENRAEG